MEREIGGEAKLCKKPSETREKRRGEGASETVAREGAAINPSAPRSRTLSVCVRRSQRMGRQGVGAAAASLLGGANPGPLVACPVPQPKGLQTEPFPGD